MARALRVEQNKNFQLIEGHFEEPKGSMKKPFSLEEIIAEGTGLRMNTASWLKTKERRDKLKQQSETMANVLEEHGVQSRIDRGNLCFIGLVSGIVHKVEQFRNINFIPSVAQVNRSVYQKELAFYLERHPYARYGVITYGQRIESFHDLRKAMSDFGRKISKWAKDCRDIYHMDVICRIFEFPRDEDGTYHLHANIVYEPFYKLQKSEFSAWLSFTHEYFGTVWKDCGRIENLQELVKYPFKPESLEGAEGAELVWLQKELHKMRIFTAFGAFAKWRGEYKESGLKIILKDGQAVMMKKESFIVRDEYTREERDKDGEPGDAENQIFAVTVPCFMSGPIKEPYALVRDYKAFPKGEASMSRFADVMMWKLKALDAWERNGGGDPAILRSFWEAQKNGANVDMIKRRPKAETFSVHNTTITVQDSSNLETKILPFSKKTDPKKPPDPRKWPSFLEDFF